MKTLLIALVTIIIVQAQPQPQKPWSGYEVRPDSVHMCFTVKEVFSVHTLGYYFRCAGTNLCMNTDVDDWWSLSPVNIAIGWGPYLDTGYVKSQGFRSWKRFMVPMNGNWKAHELQWDCTNIHFAGPDSLLLMLRSSRVLSRLEIEGELIAFYANEENQDTSSVVPGDYICEVVWLTGVKVSE